MSQPYNRNDHNAVHDTRPFNFNEWSSRHHKCSSATCLSSLGYVCAHLQYCDIVPNQANSQLSETTIVGSSSSNAKFGTVVAQSRNSTLHFEGEKHMLDWASRLESLSSARRACSAALNKCWVDRTTSPHLPIRHPGDLKLCLSEIKEHTEYYKLRTPLWMLEWMETKFSSCTRWTKLNWT